jgi:hypothetical protein
VDKDHTVDDKPVEHYDIGQTGDNHEEEMFGDDQNGHDRVQADGRHSEVAFRVHGDGRGALVGHIDHLLFLSSVTASNFLTFVNIFLSIIICPLCVK